MVATLFGAAAERAGARRVEVGPVRDVAQLLGVLAEQVPSLRDLLPRCLVAVNRVYAGPETPLGEGDEVAIIPPVSGGGPFLISEAPLAAEPLIAAVAHPEAGAVVTFHGTVRATTGDWQTAELWYEAYPEMAVAEMERIAASLTARWPGVRLAMAHRVGRLRPGEVAVVVAASAPHRGDAFAAAAAAIEAVKTTVPIWKKEVGTDGRSFWVEHA
jgi:molybdopterin synthase catalytic subunit/molybdopterin converting factor small subunit